MSLAHAQSIDSHSAGATKSSGSISSSSGRSFFFFISSCGRVLIFCSWSHLGFVVALGHTERLAQPCACSWLVGKNASHFVSRKEASWSAVSAHVVRPPVLSGAPRLPIAPGAPRVCDKGTLSTSSRSGLTPWKRSSLNRLKEQPPLPKVAETPCARHIPHTMGGFQPLQPAGYADELPGSSNDSSELLAGIR